MSDNPLIANLLERVRALRSEAAGLEGVLAAQQVAVRLDRAWRRWESSGGLQRPLHIAFLGGTGVGKSLLFNALVGKSEASPTSDTVRVFTKVPHVAVHPAERPLVHVPTEPPPVLLDAWFSGVVLCDTPDVDGMLRENWETTRSLLEHSDLVLYVTEPDRRASFRITEEVLDWARQKRWYFVLNKADMYEEDLDRIRRDLDQRIRELGFEASDATRFLVSARQLERFDGPRLRAALFHPRPEEQRALLRLDGLAGYAQFAVVPELLGPIREKKGILEGRELELRARVHQTYVEGLRTPEASAAFRLVVRESCWRKISQRCGPFMWLPVWLRCRFSMFWASYQVSRLAMGGLSVFGLIGVAFTSLLAALRGFLPLRQIVAALGPRYRQQMTEIRNDALRILEDQGLLNVVPEEPKEDEALKASGALAQAAKQWPGIGGLVERAIRGLSLQGIDDDVLAQLENDVERLGEYAAGRTLGGLGGGLFKLIANLVPAGILGWILVRVGQGWYQEKYLDFSFYLMALGLIMVSFLPGMLLISLRLRFSVSRLDAGALVRQVDQPRATASLRQVSQRLDQFVRGAERLGQLITETRHTLALEGGLDPALFGAAARGK